MARNGSFVRGLFPVKNIEATYESQGMADLMRGDPNEVELAGIDAGCWIEVESEVAIESDACIAASGVCCKQAKSRFVGGGNADCTVVGSAAAINVGAKLPRAVQIITSFMAFVWLDCLRMPVPSVVKFTSILTATASMKRLAQRLMQFEIRSVVANVHSRARRQIERGRRGGL